VGPGRSSRGWSSVRRVGPGPRPPRRRATVTQLRYPGPGAGLAGVDRGGHAFRGPRGSASSPRAARSPGGFVG
jgi:hypothetical protein